jgi:hypothetical protein
MSWYLVSSIIVATCGGMDCGINPGYQPTTREVRILMPSKDVCEGIALLNRGYECWAKSEHIK